MSIDIEDESVLANIDKLAKRLGVSPEEAVHFAVKEAHRRHAVEREADEADRSAQIDALQERVARLPVLDARPWREIAADVAGDAEPLSGEADRAA